VYARRGQAPLTYAADVAGGAAAALLAAPLLRSLGDVETALVALVAAGAGLILVAPRLRDRLVGLAPSLVMAANLALPGGLLPFISENGGGIFIPQGYFPDETVLEVFSPISEKGYRVIRLGTPYHELRMVVGELRIKAFHHRFRDLSGGLVELTGLPPEEALLCKERDFDEPFLFHGDEEKEALFRAIRNSGLATTQGVYYHLLGNNDKESGENSQRNIPCPVRFDHDHCPRRQSQ
jgi:hypothetical protein